NYFNLAIPGLTLFIFALYLPVRKDQNIINQILNGELGNKHQTQNTGYYLVATGLIFQLISPFAPSSLGFVFTILSNLSLIGLIYIIYYSNNILIVWIGISLYLLTGLIGGMLGNFLWPLIFIGIYYLKKYPLNLLVKLLGFSTLVIFVIVLQSTKLEYRRAVWFGQGSLAGLSSFEVWTTLIKEKIDKPKDLFKPEVYLKTAGRLNQGYLTSLAMTHTPYIEPYANGETLFIGVLGAFIPRVFWPDKPQAGGGVNMRRFAGIELGGSTSMNIGHFGEAYVNFGVNGGVLILVLYGLLINFILSYLEGQTGSPNLILWIPLFAQGLISFGSDISISINHILKYSIIIGFIFYAFRNRV
ncbi:MAG: hypothetical protein AAFO07_18585, partial [Bacteroidota bacterium]